VGSLSPQLLSSKERTLRLCRHSDKEKFRSDLNRPKGWEMSERLLKTLRKSGDCLSEVWIHFVELSHLPDGSPTEIAVAGFPQIQVRELLDPAPQGFAMGA
jgi:hypothetical protein